MLAFRPIGERKLVSEQSIDKALLGRGVTARGRVFSFFPYLSPAVCRFFYLCNVNARPLPNLQTITRENELFFKRNSVPVIFLSSQTKLNQRGYIEWGVDVENFFILSLFEKAFHHSPPPSSFGLLELKNLEKKVSSALVRVLFIPALTRRPGKQKSRGVDRFHRSSSRGDLWRAIWTGFVSEGRRLA